MIDYSDVLPYRSFDLAFLLCIRVALNNGAVASSSQCLLPPSWEGTHLLKNSFLAILLDLCLVTLPFSPRSSLVLSNITVTISHNHRLLYSLALVHFRLHVAHSSIYIVHSLPQFPHLSLYPHREQKWGTFNPFPSTRTWIAIPAPGET